MLFDIEDAHRVAAVQRQRAEPKAPALGAERPYLPALGDDAAQAADHAAGVVPGQSGVVFDLQPKFGQPAAVDDFELFFGKLAHLAAPGAGDAAQTDGAQTVPRPHIAEDQDACQQIG